MCAAILRVNDAHGGQYWKLNNIRFYKIYDSGVKWFEIIFVKIRQNSVITLWYGNLFFRRHFPYKIRFIFKYEIIHQSTVNNSDFSGTYNSETQNVVWKKKRSKTDIDLIYLVTICVYSRVIQIGIIVLLKSLMCRPCTTDLLPIIGLLENAQLIEKHSQGPFAYF